MPKSIDLLKLEQLLESAPDFPAEAGKYFEPVADSSGRPSFQLKSGITVTGAGTTADSRYWQYQFKDIPGGIAGWLIRQEVKNRLRKYDRKIAVNPNATRIVAEGDSWFQHPLICDLLDWVERDPDLAVHSLASGGAELRQMVDPADYAVAVKAVKPSVFLLSAGGNDFLGDIRPFLIPWKPKPGNRDTLFHAQDYISPAFPKLIQQLRAWLDEIIGTVLATRSVQRVILHSYDYVIPNTPDDDRAGAWLGAPMRELGLTVDYLQTDIVERMVDAWCEQMMAVSQDPRWKGKVRFVDFRGSLTRTSQWFDEIHPKSKPFEKLAKQLIAAIKAP